MNSLFNVSQKTNANIESDWRTNQKSIITVAAKVQTHNSFYYLNIACICHHSLEESFRTRKSSQKYRFMKEKCVSFTCQRRLDRFRILEFVKKRTLNEGSMTEKNKIKQV